MSDIRFDPVTRQWVSIAENRRGRPVQFVPIEPTRHQIICPFCAGNEDETPGTIVAFDKHLQSLDPQNDEELNWSVRVIPNKYPAFEGDNGAQAVGPYTAINDFGVQELIIPTPRHIVSIAELGYEELKRALHAARMRIESLESDGLKHAMFFNNCRVEAGASIEHIHFQLIGSPMVSNQLLLRRQFAEEHFVKHKRSLMSDLANWELDQKVRLVHRTKNFAVFCPYASRLPVTIWIVPLQTPQKFTESDLVDELAELTQDAVRRLEGLLERPSYNVLLHIAPFQVNDPSVPDHWYVEVFPRMTRIAGYEWGTDLWINSVSPEIAAKRLRVVE